VDEAQVQQTGRDVVTLNASFLSHLEQRFNILILHEAIKFPD
jgi:hypothetical protein